MQKLIKLRHWTENKYTCHKDLKTVHNSYFLKETSFTRNSHEDKFKKIVCFGITRFLDLDNVTCIFVKKLE